MAGFTSISCSVQDGVGQLELNRPAKSNSISKQMWEELPRGVEWLLEQGARVVVLSGAGKNFCAGIDLPSLMAEFQQQQQEPPGGGAACPGRQRYHFRQFVFVLQDAMSAFERCQVPVIAAVHGHCVGAGIDLITACDIRLATSDATLCVKEADLAIVADMGTLQRLPSIVGHGIAAELALTARSFSGAEAQAMHLVARAFPDRDALLAGALALACQIAAKSPLAVAGTKRVLLYQRDSRTVQEGLDYVATWNAAMLPQSADIQEVFAAAAQRRRPLFSKL